MTKPHEPIPMRVGAGPIWAALYAVIALAGGAFAAYSRFVGGLGLMEPQVLFPSLFAVWFSIRAFFAFNAKR